MLQAIQGIYRNGKIELLETPQGITESEVVVTFLTPQTASATSHLMSFGMFAGEQQSTSVDFNGIVCEFLQDFAKDDPEAQLVFDPVHDRYLVMHNGWRGESRIYGCAMQLDIIDGQVWIQHNSTEILIEQELTRRGVLPKDIILGLRSPSVRKILAAALEHR